MTSQLELQVLPDRLAVCRIDTPKTYHLNLSICFLSVTKTPEEFSIVCPETEVPRNCRSETGWRALKVKGPLDFELTGILAGISGVLSEAGISIFAISTFDTDYILVRSKRLQSAVSALEAAGYRVRSHDF
jgi:hypothetical protein